MNDETEPIGITTGTVLMFMGHGPLHHSWLPRGIRIIIGNKITHVAAVVESNDDGTLTIIESDAGGGRVFNTTLQELKTRQGTWLISRANLLPTLRGQYGFYENFKRECSFISKEPGFKSYSYRSLAGLALSHLLGRITNSKPVEVFRPNGYICSSLIANLLNRSVGRKIFLNPDIAEPDDFTSPLLFDIKEV